MNSHEFGFPPFYIDSYHPLCLPSVSDSGRLAYFSFVCLFSLSIKGSYMLPCKEEQNIEELPRFSLRTKSSFVSIVLRRFSQFRLYFIGILLYFIISSRIL